MAGVTGTKTFAAADVSAAVTRIRRASVLPCAVGFGIKTPEQAAEIARIADAAAVGSAIVTRIEAALRQAEAACGVQEREGAEALFFYGFFYLQHILGSFYADS